MSFWSDVINDVKLILESAGGNLPNAEQNPALAGAPAQTASDASGLGIVHVVEAIWTELTNGKMWRSLGWLLLGIVLMLLAVGWWIGPSAARRSPAGLAAEGLS